MRLFAVVDAISAKIFYTLSAWRGARIFHPRGSVYTGTLALTNSRSLPPCKLFEVSTHSIIVRLSRGVGLPPKLPDILGFALRISNAYGQNFHQDILMVTCGCGKLSRYAMQFKHNFSSSFFSTILPYQIGGKNYLFGLIPSSPPSAPDNKVFTLAVASPLGPWQRVGEIRLAKILSSEESEKINYNPWNTGGGIKPIGFLQRLRQNSYKASQHGRKTL